MCAVPEQRLVGGGFTTQQTQQQPAPPLSPVDRARCWDPEPRKPPAHPHKVANVLGSEFGALVIEPEHRFYGESMPMPVGDDNGELGLLTPMQALADTAEFIRHHQKLRNCTARGSLGLRFGFQASVLGLGVGRACRHAQRQFTS